MIFEYWRTKLNAREMQFYDDLYSAFLSGRNSAVVRGLSREAVTRVYSYFKCDHPELFFISNAPVMSARMFSDVSFVSRSIYPPAEVRRRESALKEAVAEVESMLPYGADECQKEFAVTEYIVDRVQYAIDNTRNQDASSVLYAGKAQCSGISCAVKYLLDNLGVKCISVMGDLRTEKGAGPHTWNIVFIGGTPYHLDVTSIIGSNKRGVKPYRFNYFNLTDKQVASYSWDRASAPRCDKNFVPPQSIKSNPSATVTLTSSAYENSGNALIIPSLYEFRRAFSAELNKAHNEFIFMSKIKCDDDNELMKIIAGACRQCFTQKGISYAVRISISEGMVTITW